MSTNFDNFPVYDALVAADGKLMSQVWIAFMSSFVQTLTGYLSQNGIFAPPLTTAQRDALTNPIGGQIIYNTTTGRLQGYEIQVSPALPGWRDLTP